MLRIMGVQKIIGNGLNYLRRINRGSLGIAPLSSTCSLAMHKQIRLYAARPPLSTVKTTCWNCKYLNTSKGAAFPMSCPQCGILQELTTAVNYFDLLNCPQCFDIDKARLTKNFRELQAFVHPDKYASSSKTERANSATWSALVNKAYATLSSPMERAKYLLDGSNVEMPRDNRSLSHVFLAEMMERNEEVEKASTVSQLRALDESLVKEMDEKCNLLSKFFAERNFDRVKSILIEMKFVQSMLIATKKKLTAALIESDV